jgi:arylsulfatase A-like enzyme
LRGLKTDLYEGGIRVPFIARWPGRIAPGSTSHLVSAQFDMLATLADLTGSPAPPTEGISLLPELLGRKGQQHHEFLYFEFPEKNGQVAVRMGKWKAVKSNLRKNPGAAWELYDLDNDRSETTNLAAQHPDILRQMDAILQREHQPTPVKAWQLPLGGQ